MSWDHRYGGRWVATIHLGGRQQEIGRFRSEEEAALARDRVAAFHRRNRVKLNFPGRKVRPAPLEEVRKELKRAVKAEMVSRFRGVALQPGENPKRRWGARLQLRHWLLPAGGRLGFWPTEEEAAVAYDRAGLYYRERLGLRVELNFPTQATKLVPASASALRSEARRAFKKTTSSRFRGVAWDQEAERWVAQIRRPELGRQTKIGRFDDEIEAARAYDREARRRHGHHARLNFHPTTGEEMWERRLRELHDKDWRTPGRPRHKTSK